MGRLQSATAPKAPSPSDIVRLVLEAVIASSNVHITAAKAATTTVPIVMVYATDPVGMEDTLARACASRAGNITGTAGSRPEIRARKLVEFVAECRSGLARLTRPSSILEVSRATGSCGHTSSCRLARGPGHHDPGCRGSREGGRKSLAQVSRTQRPKIARPKLSSSGMVRSLWTQKDRIAEPAARHLPAYRHTPLYRGGVRGVVGGLLSARNQSSGRAWHRAAAYVDRIRSQAPQICSVEQPTKFELVINLKTAKALGLTIPPPLLARADEVIQ